MTFEDRRRIASEKLVDFLADFTAPRGLDDSQMARRITQIADAFARKMPIGATYEEKIDALFEKLRDSHLSNTWPPQAAFVELMPKSEFRGSAPATFAPKSDDWIAKKMAAGQPVPETEVWKNQLVERDTLDRYRFAAVQGWRSVYHGEAEAMMVKRYGSIVRRYFLEAAE